MPGAASPTVAGSSPFSAAMDLPTLSRLAKATSMSRSSSQA